MNDRVYCTSAIVSINAQPNNKTDDVYVWVPHQRGVQNRRFFGTKIITYGNGWAPQHNVNENMHLLNLKYWFLKEDEATYQDVTQMTPDMVDYRMDIIFPSIQESNFHKWFQTNYGKEYYYVCDINPIGIVKKIDVWKKGYISLSFTSGWSDDIYIVRDFPDEKIVDEELKRICLGLQNYRFFRLINNNTDIEFFNIE